MSLELLGYGKGAVHMALEAQRQGAESTGQQKSFKRRELGAEVRVSNGIDPVDEMRSASYDARHRVAVASDIFGGRVKYEIGSVSDRLLEDGCGPGIIDHGYRTDFVGRLRQAANMLKLEDHRSRTFEIEQRRTGNIRFDGLRFGVFDIITSDTETGQQLLEKAIGIAVAVADRDHAIAGLHNR